MPEDDTERKLRERFTTDLETGKAFMDPIHMLMDKYYEQYRNRNTADKECKFKVSDLYGYVETVVPILTNNRVRSTVKSDYPQYIRHAEGLTDILSHVYDVNNWDYEGQEIARMAEIYRSSIAYSGYDGEYKNGSGKLCLYGCNIRWCYLDPAAAKFEDSSFFFYVEPKRKTEVIKLHPDKKTEIEQTIGKKDALQKSDSKVRRWFQTFFTSIKNAFVSSSPPTTVSGYLAQEYMSEQDEADKHKNSVAYIHHWYRDDDDKWRVSYWADDVFLEDMENPFWHGRLPYDIYNPTKDILSSMGVPMAEHIENLNWEKNVMMNLIVQSAKRAVDPPLLYNTAAGLKDPQGVREKAKETGTIAINNPDFVPLNAIADFVNFPGLESYVINLPEQFSAMEDRLTGVNDSFRGMADATSGKETQLKQEAAYTRIKTKIDNYEFFNKSIAEKIVVNSMQFYKTTRAFRIKGDYMKYQDMLQQPQAPQQPDQQQMQQPQQGQPEQPAPQQQAFDVKPVPNGKNPETGEPTYDRSEYYLYANPNEWTKIEEQEAQDEAGQGDQPPATEEEVKQAFRVLQMTVEIEAGSSLPQSRMARREEALELGEKGFIDQEAVLDAYDWPNRDEVIKRMQKAAAAAQDAEMQKIQTEAQLKQAPPKSPIETINFKDLPPQGQEQLAQQAGINISAQDIVGHQVNTAQITAASKPQPNQQPGQGQPAQPQRPDIAGGLDKIRQAVPELANMPDDVLMKLIAGMQQHQ